MYDDRSQVPFLVFSNMILAMTKTYFQARIIYERLTIVKQFFGIVWNDKEYDKKEEYEDVNM